jgi:hypothetical protein
MVVIEVVIMRVVVVAVVVVGWRQGSPRLTSIVAFLMLGRCFLLLVVRAVVNFFGASLNVSLSFSLLRQPHHHHHPPTSISLYISFFSSGG